MVNACSERGYVMRRPSYTRLCIAIAYCLALLSYCDPVYAFACMAWLLLIGALVVPPLEQ